MNTFSRPFLIGAVVVLGTPVVNAGCDNARLISSFVPGLSGSSSSVHTPGIIPEVGLSSTVSQSILGSFWALGFGDPQAGVGVDNGLFAAHTGDAGWLYLPSGAPALITSTWAGDPGIDGCIDQIDSAAVACTAVLLSDDDGEGRGHFALLTKHADRSRNYLYDQLGNDPILLAPIPAPMLAGQTDGHFVLELATITSDGFYLDGDCVTLVPGDVLAGYRIYERSVAPGTAPPISRSRAQWRVSIGGETVEGGPLPLDGQATIPLDCSVDKDVYYATSLVFESGFEAGHVSSDVVFTLTEDCGNGVDDDCDGLIDRDDLPDCEFIGDGDDDDDDDDDDDPGNRDDDDISHHWTVPKRVERD